MMGDGIVAARKLPNGVNPSHLEVLVKNGLIGFIEIGTSCNDAKEG